MIFLVISEMSTVHGTKNLKHIQNSFLEIGFKLISIGYSRVVPRRNSNNNSMIVDAIKRSVAVVNHGSGTPTTLQKKYSHTSKLI